MASRTRIPEIDRALAAFIRQGSVQLGAGEIRVDRLRRPDVADGICSHVADAVSPFLQESGLDAQSVWLYAEELYPARPRHGYRDHCVTQVRHEGRRFTIDFTGAQYGLDDFPAVCRATPEGWTLDWDHRKAPWVDASAGIAGRWIYPVAALGAVA
jgi:hypothetical protein